MPRPLIPHRRERILDAAEALILDRGFDAMSVQSVAERAGIAKGAVYREFASKREILDVLLRRSMERMSRAASRRLGGTGAHSSGGAASLGEAYRVGVQVLMDDPLMTAAFLDDEGVLGSYVGTVTDGRYRARYLGARSWIEGLQARGALSREIEADALALALSSTTIGLLTAAKLLGPLSREQLEAAIRAVEVMVSKLETASPAVGGV